MGNWYGDRHNKVKDVPPQKVPLDEIGFCKYCKHQVVWLVSKKTGKKYPVNILENTHDTADDTIEVKKNDFHQCIERDLRSGWKERNE